MRSDQWKWGLSWKGRHAGGALDSHSWSGGLDFSSRNVDGNLMFWASQSWRASFDSSVL